MQSYGVYKVHRGNKSYIISYHISNVCGVSTFRYDDLQIISIADSHSSWSVDCKTPINCNDATCICKVMGFTNVIEVTSYILLVKLQSHHISNICGVSTFRYDDLQIISIADSHSS